MNGADDLHKLIIKNIVEPAVNFIVYTLKPCICLAPDSVLDSTADIMSGVSNDRVELASVPGEMMMESDPHSHKPLSVEIVEDIHPAETTPEHDLDASTAEKKQARPRIWFVDWMRSVAIYLVVAVHIAVSLRRITKVDSDLDEKINAAMRSLIQCGMPLFFYFSGRAAALSRDAFPTFLYKKAMRLLVPLVFGYVLIVLPTAYIGRSYRPCAAKDIDNFFEFAGDFFVNGFSCGGFEWLWFLPVLFGYSLANYPLFTWMKIKYANTGNAVEYSPKDTLYLGIMLVLATLFVVGFHLADLIPIGWSLLVVSPYVLNIMSMYLLPWIRWSQQLGIVFLTNAIPSLVMAYVQIDMIDIWHHAAAITYYNVFYMQGFIDHMFYEEYKEFKKKKIHLMFRPLSLFALILSLSICSPGTTTGVGYLFTYPLYFNQFNRVTYVLGTWVYIILFVRWGQSFYNETLCHQQYKHGMRSTIIVYLIHWLFIDLIQVLIVQPLDLSFGLAFVIEVPLTVLACWGFYVFITRVPYVGLVFGFTKPPVKSSSSRSKGTELDASAKL